LVKALDGGTGDTGVRATRSGAMMGTAHYMSPEQIRSTKHVDERSDIWALGVIFYEMLTGTVPFDGSDTFEIFASVTTGAYKPLTEMRPELPERMVKAVEAALIIDVDERVASVEKLRALWLGVEHVPAAPHEGRTSSGAWDPTMLDKYATTSQPFSEPSGSMNTWVEPSGKAKTSGHTLTPGMGVDSPSESSSNKGPWIVLALGAAMGVVGLLGLAFLVTRWPSPEAEIVDAPPTVETPAAAELPPVGTAEPTEARPAPEPTAAAPAPEPIEEPAARPVPAPVRPAVAPSPAPTPQPVVEPEIVVTPKPRPAPVTRPAPKAPTTGSFVLSGHDAGDSAYLAPADGGRYVRPGGSLAPGEYKLFFKVGDKTLPMGSKTVTAGQGLKATCQSRSQACHLTVVEP
ncbi:MAG: protein kinase, partial [Proteobacteria bacterium]|nr:protein kinase [Pseudomonadota bacterium]